VHAESCAECTLRIGAMALESHDVGVALRLAKKLAVQSAKAPRFPTVLVGAAVVVAAVCGAPAILEGLPGALAWIFALPHAVPILTTTFVAVAKNGSSSAVSLAATFALALAGWAVARASRNPGVTS